MHSHPAEDSDSVEILTDEQFDAARSVLWQNRDPARNWERTVVTDTFTVESKENGGGAARTDIIESISPDIHVYTSNDMTNGRRCFLISATGRHSYCRIDVDTTDFSLVTEIHYAIVQRFNALGAVRSAIEWLMDCSRFAHMDGQNGGPLLNT